MRELFHLIFLLSICLCLSANAQEDPFDQGGFCIIGLNEQETRQTSEVALDTTLSSHGFDFTPRGDLRVLTIFVDFEGTTDENQSFNGWDAGQLPDIVDPDSGRISFAAQEDTDFSPLGNPAPDAQRNISEFFYHMSNGEFRLFYETLKDDDGNPILIQIDVDGDTATNTPPTEFSIDLNALVFAKINELFPDRDWSNLGFDIRPDRPDFRQDASGTDENPNPNNVLDFVTIVYRYRRNFEQPVNGIADFPFSPDISSTAGVGAATLFEDHPLSNDFSAAERGGFTLFQYSTNTSNLIRLFLHELSHNFILHPHTSVENTVHGRGFNAYRDWSMMDYGRSSSIANAWERWYSGWITIKHDLNSSEDNGSYILSDYMQTGDAMRLQIPNTTDQFLWLTFRSDTDNPFYQRTRLDSEVARPANTPPNEIPLPISNEGLYGLFERIAATQKETDPFDLFVDGGNGTRIMDGKGFFDYSLAEIIRPQSPVLLGLTQGRENPYGQLGTAVIYREDLNQDDIIRHLPTVNGGGNSNEIGTIQEVDGIPVFGRNATNVSLADGKYSAFTNPPIANFIEFNDFEPNNPFEPFEDDGLEALSPTILHSLSFTSERIGDDIQIMVNYNDGHIENDFRMTGNILLPPDERITLDPNVALTIDRSGANGRETLASSNDFIHETAFVAANGSYFCASQNATVIIDQGATVVFETGSGLTLDTNAQIIIRGGAQLCINTALLTLDPSAQIIVEDGFINSTSSVDLSQNIVFTDPDFSAFGTAPDCDIDFFFGTTPVPQSVNAGDETLAAALQVFPNPSRTRFNVSIQNTRGPFTYRLINVNGQLIREELENKNNFSLDISSLETGIYFFSISGNDIQEVQKVIKL